MVPNPNFHPATASKIPIGTKSELLETLSLFPKGYWSNTSKQKGRRQTRDQNKAKKKKKKLIYAVMEYLKINFIH